MPLFPVSTLRTCSCRDLFEMNVAQGRVAEWPTSNKAANRPTGVCPSVDGRSHRGFVGLCCVCQSLAKVRRQSRRASTGRRKMTGIHFIITVVSRHKVLPQYYAFSESVPTSIAQDTGFEWPRKGKIDQGANGRDCKAREKGDLSSCSASSECPLAST